MVRRCLDSMKLDWSRESEIGAVREMHASEVTWQ